VSAGGGGGVGARWSRCSPGLARRRLIAAARPSQGGGWALAVVLAAAACAAPSVASDPGAGAPLGGKAPPSLAPLAGGEPALDPAIVAAADPRSVALPLRAYELDDGAARTVNRARVIVGDACMRRFGFSPIPGWQPEGAVTASSWARYGLWDPIAADRGYQAPEVNSGNTYPIRYLGLDASQVYLGEIGEYHGLSVPPGGCQGEEFTRVMRPAGRPAVDGHFVADLDAEAHTRASQDARVARRAQAWTACMKQAGFHFADVQAPFAYWSERRTVVDKTHEIVGAEEKASARADLDCKRSTGLLGTWLAADVAYSRRIIERESERLREYQRASGLILDNANHIIAAGG